MAHPRRRDDDDDVRYPPRQQRPWIKRQPTGVQIAVIAAGAAVLLWIAKVAWSVIRKV